MATKQNVRLSIFMIIILFVSKVVFLLGVVSVPHFILQPKKSFGLLINNFWYNEHKNPFVYIKVI